MPFLGMSVVNSLHKEELSYLAPTCNSYRFRQEKTGYVQDTQCYACLQLQVPFVKSLCQWRTMLLHATAPIYLLAQACTLLWCEMKW